MGQASRLQLFRQQKQKEMEDQELQHKKQREELIQQKMQLDSSRTMKSPSTVNKKGLRIETSRPMSALAKDNQALQQLQNELDQIACESDSVKKNRSLLKIKEDLQRSRAASSRMNLGISRQFSIT